MVTAPEDWVETISQALADAIWYRQDLASSIITNKNRAYQLKLIERYRERLRELSPRHPLAAPGPHPLAAPGPGGRP